MTMKLMVKLDQQKNFGELAEFFRLDGLDFNRKDFYYPFRNIGSSQNLQTI